MVFLKSVIFNSYEASVLVGPPAGPRAMDMGPRGRSCVGIPRLGDQDRWEELPKRPARHLAQVRSRGKTTGSGHHPAISSSAWGRSGDFGRFEDAVKAWLHIFPDSGAPGFQGRGLPVCAYGLCFLPLPGFVGTRPQPHWSQLGPGMQSDERDGARGFGVRNWGQFELSFASY